MKESNLEIAELGLGGGKGDLDQKEELEFGTVLDIEKIMETCKKDIQDQQLLSKVSDVLTNALKEGKSTIDLAVDLTSIHDGEDADVSLENLSSILSSHVNKPLENSSILNRTIRFPYSRHSSFYELCHLVDAFKPRDLFPCTVDEKTWDPELSMRHLFEPFCSGDTFCHDNEMMKIYEARLEEESHERSTQDASQDETQSNGVAQGVELDHLDPDIPNEGSSTPAECVIDLEDFCTATTKAARIDTGMDTELRVPEAFPPTSETTSSLQGKRSTKEALYTARQRRHKRLKNAKIAYEAALGINGLTWADLGGLVSARTNYEEEEL